ncbi:MAG: NAD(P)/FAD-dependent oxidoreductase [Rhodobacteraceae bacterium]|nr:NAD(P)/FAD-dependent oxidoreductase [Paracoccaceae bacterium]
MIHDTIIIGAGAAGMMCAAHTCGRTLVIDHARAPGEKIRISGGGRCNFTNLATGPENFLSQNPHFAKSALARYTPSDFLDLIARHEIAWHEKARGQLFCDGKATQIVNMLRLELARNGADLWLQSTVSNLRATPDGFSLTVTRNDRPQHLTTRNLVIATGGKSIPKMGATGLAYDIARQFNIPVTETCAALVPFTFADQRFKALSGISLPVRASNTRISFDEDLLFTHRGLSGPAILQLSSYWAEGAAITLNLIPDTPLLDSLRAQRQTTGRRQLSTELTAHFPQRLVDYLSHDLNLTRRLADMSDDKLQTLCENLSNWRLTPTGTEGYRTAEVTLGGIDTNALNSSTMATKSHPNLYFIGEAVDVTGWLGGYNFQWAWASGHAAGHAISRGPQ